MAKDHLIPDINDLDAKSFPFAGPKEAPPSPYAFPRYEFKFQDPNQAGGEN